MNEKKDWYIVYTRARCEKKVVASLTKKEIENYCPLNKIVSQVNDGATWLYEPLFTSFVFVHVTNAEHTTIKQLPGVLNIVYWLGEPAIIKEAEINTIRYFLNQYEHIKLEKIPININDEVKIMREPFILIENNRIDVKSRSTKISLPSVGYAMIIVEREYTKIVEIEKLNREVINFKEALSKFKKLSNLNF